jgi:predicted deacylase
MLAAASPSIPAAPVVPAYALAPDAMLDRFRALERAHPDLVEIRDIGDSVAKVNGVGGHDIWAVVLTDERVQGAKQVVGNLGAVHGDELVAPALLTEFAEQLAAGYGSDPISTHLLRNREIHLVPMVNPDGVQLAHATLGPEGWSQGRPNANGVNLNRNFPFRWGGDGAGVLPEQGNYRGPAPASEPETRAVVEHFTAHRPSVLTDWHNHGRLNLHVWGDTLAEGPTSAGQRDVAMRVSTRNGYTAQSSAALYPASGGSTDWAHGELGSTALTIETGESHAPDVASYEQVRRENMPALFDVALIGDRPVQSSRGPRVGTAMLHGGLVQGWGFDDQSGGQAIVGAELVYGADAEPGTGIALAPQDGAFDSSNEAFELPFGRRRGPKDGLAYVRMQDADGNWGALAPFWTKPPSVPAPEQSAGAVDFG